MGCVQAKHPRDEEKKNQNQPQTRQPQQYPNKFSGPMTQCAGCHQERHTALLPDSCKVCRECIQKSVDFGQGSGRYVCPGCKNASTYEILSNALMQMGGIGAGQAPSMNRFYASCCQSDHYADYSDDRCKHTMLCVQCFKDKSNNNREAQMNCRPCNRNIRLLDMVMIGNHLSCICMKYQRRLVMPCRHMLCPACVGDMFQVANQTQQPVKCLICNEVFSKDSSDRLWAESREQPVPIVYNTDHQQLRPVQPAQAANTNAQQLPESNPTLARMPQGQSGAVAFSQERPPDPAMAHSPNQLPPQQSGQARGCQKCGKPSVVKMRCDHLFFCLHCFKQEPHQIMCPTCNIPYFHPQIIYFDERGQACVCGLPQAFREHQVPECGHQVCTGCVKNGMDYAFTNKVDFACPICDYGIPNQIANELYHRARVR